jgi:uncharacterized protein YbcI
MPVEHEQSKTGVLAAQISRAVVHIWREYTGRGPTKTQTTITEDLVIVLMSDTLLKAERNLANDGRLDEVLSIRRAYQDTMRQDLTTAVEHLTGRTVAAFMSHNNVDPDLSAELFVLVPKTG